MVAEMTIQLYQNVDPILLNLLIDLLIGEVAYLAPFICESSEMDRLNRQKHRAQRPNSRSF